MNAPWPVTSPIAHTRSPAAVTIRSCGWGTSFSDVADHYVDFIVGPPGLPYRILDLHELGEAMTSGKLTPHQVAHVLAATQTFADRYLQGKDHHGPDWPDVPPAALAPVRNIAIPSP